MDVQSPPGNLSAEELQMLATIHQVATAVLQHGAACGLFVSPRIPAGAATGPAPATPPLGAGPGFWGGALTLVPPTLQPLSPPMWLPLVPWATPPWATPPWATPWSSAAWTMPAWNAPPIPAPAPYPARPWTPFGFACP